MFIKNCFIVTIPKYFELFTLLGDVINKYQKAFWLPAVTFCLLSVTMMSKLNMVGTIDKDCVSQVSPFIVLFSSARVYRPRPDHYFPDLHHLKFEIEEGSMLDGRPVRFGYNLLEFPDFSWRGYAQMSPIQVGAERFTTYLGFFLLIYFKRFYFLIGFNNTCNYYQLILHLLSSQVLPMICNH